MRTSEKNYVKQKSQKQIDGFYQYIDDVVNKKIVVCDLIRRAVDRHLNDMDNAESRGYYFNETIAECVMRFFTTLKHAKGEWGRSPIILEPWEKFFIGSIYGWLHIDTGFRRFSTAYLEVARKNGKSILASGIGLYSLDMDDEPGAEVYSFATKKDQARIVFDVARNMVITSPVLKNRIDVYKDSLVVEETMSKFQPLSADFSTLDGLNVSCAIGDELHAQKYRELWGVINTARGARRQSLLIGITTAGTDMHGICREQHDYTEKILNGVLSDDSFFGLIYTLDTDDKWNDSSTWIKANPNLGVSVKMDTLRKEAAKCEFTPSALNEFMRWHLNIWTQAETTWITHDAWKESGTITYDNDSLIGQKCWGGLDLSSNNDITALTLTFRQSNGEYYNLYHFWIPRDNIEARARKDRVPYDLWVREGYVTATDGNVIDKKFIEHYIIETAQKYKIQELAVDPHDALEVSSNLLDAGVNVIEFRQGFLSMSPACKSFEEKILRKEYRHNNNPVMGWMLSNVVLRIDPAGNIKPDKGKSREKIDGVISSVMALQRAILAENKKESIYASRGVRSVRPDEPPKTERKEV